MRTGQVTLRAVAARVNSKISACADYDPNVCAFHADPSSPATIVLDSGQPFVCKTTYIKDGQRVRLQANDDSVAVILPFQRGQIAAGMAPIAIKRPDQILFLRPTKVVLKDGIRLFTETGVLTGEQQRLLRSAGVEQLLTSTDAEETVSLVANRITIYLHCPTPEKVLRVVDCAVAVIRCLAFQSAQIDFDILPASLKSLVPLVESWGIRDDDERSERRRNASRDTLKRIVDAVKPRLAEIDSYLDGFRGAPMPEAATALGALAEFVVETDLQLNDLRMRD